MLKDIIKIDNIKFTFIIIIINEFIKKKIVNSGMIIILIDILVN